MIDAIYCDMDQVLVNFLGGARKALGWEFNDPCLGADHNKWLILSGKPKFWIELEWMPGARRLWEYVKDKNTYILSACPRSDESPMCPAEKVIWCERELHIPSWRVVTCERYQKREYATANGKPNLLIDDHHGNVKDWRDAGGIAIHHHTIPETLNELKRLGV